MVDETYFLFLGTFLFFYQKKLCATIFPFFCHCTSVFLFGLDIASHPILCKAEEPKNSTSNS
jgi:hypothetical protein